MGSWAVSGPVTVSLGGLTLCGSQGGMGQAMSSGWVSQGQLWEQVVGSLGAQTVSPPSG